MNDITAGTGHNRGPSLEDTMRERAREVEGAVIEEVPESRVR